MKLTKINLNIEAVNVKKMDKKLIFQVTDNSMETKSGLTFPLGSYILIDPHREPKENDYVIAKPNNDDKVIFRQFLIENNSQILHPLNSEYNDVIFTDGIIYGVIDRIFQFLK